MDTNLTSSPPKRIILDHQLAAFEKLVAVATACFSIQRNTLPVNPRSNSLIIGPSGSGKTFLARAVAEEVGVEFLSISVSEWILLGASGRGAVMTWPLIFQFLLQNKGKSGAVIFVDEVDKIGGDSSWERFLRSEVFRLLDLQLPAGITNGDGDSVGRNDHASVSEVLSNRTLLLAAGAFQGIWDERSRTKLGFGSQAGPEPGLSPSTLVKTLPLELVNRFRGELVILPALGEADYRLMLERTAKEVPVYLRDTFMRLGLERIHEVARLQQGCRFLEELMLDCILHERAVIKMLKADLCSTPIEFKHEP